MKFMSETRWDKLLHIKTTGRDDSRADQYRYPYEPTPYAVLERLENSGYITKRFAFLVEQIEQYTGLLALILMNN